MKYLIFLPLFFAFANITYSQDIAFKKRMSHLAKENSTPDWIYFKEGIKVNPYTIFTNYQSEFGLGVNDKMILGKIQTDELGFKHYRYQQYYKGIKIEGAEFIVHVNNTGKVYSANGKLAYRLIQNNSPSIDSKRAISLAQKFVKAKQYMWESEVLEKDLKTRTKKIDTSYFPKPELVYLKLRKSKEWTNQNFRLAYKLDIYSSQPNNTQRIFIDAKTGEVLNSIPLESNCDGITVGTIFNNNRTIYTDLYQSNQYRLKDNCQGAAIRIRNWGTGILNVLPNEITSTNNSWTTTDQKFGASVLWATKESSRYFLNAHNRKSYDDNNGEIEGYINAIFFNSNTLTNYTDNASMSFTDGTLKVGLGSANTLEDSWATLDIIGHEYTHAVTGASAKLVYQDESGALNESFSDIFGEAIENYILGANDFLMGANRTSGPNRSLANPNAFYQPDTYLSTNSAGLWYSGTWDNGGVHENSGVQNYWFYLLANGGYGVNDNGYRFYVNGIGADKASKIAYRNLVYNLTSTSVYGDAKEGSIIAAIDLYGVLSDEVSSVIDAWCAVGLGNNCTSNSVDLVIQNPNISSLSVAPSGKLDFSCITKNQGRAPSSISHNAIWLSKNQTFEGSPTDINLNGDMAIPILAPGQSTFTEANQLTIPASTTTGTWYIMFGTDALDQNNEGTNENNNQTFVQITINPSNICTVPAITTHPSSKTVTTPAGTSFNIVASGSNNLYQWQYNTGSSWVNVPAISPYTGTSSSTLNISSTSLSMSGYQYRCIITSSCTTTVVTSNSATLTVNTSSTTCNNDLACSPKILSITNASITSCVYTSCTTVETTPPNPDVTFTGCAGIPYLTTRYDDDVWFSITPTNSNPVTIRVIPTSNLNNFDVSVGLYTGSCTALTQVGCATLSDIGVAEDLTFTPVAGTVYRIRVFSFGIGSAYSGNFDICVRQNGVTPPPADPLAADLHTSSVTLSTNSPCAGNNFDISYNIDNNGETDAGTFKVKFYLSSNSTYSDNDQLLGTSSVTGGIDADDNVSRSRSLTIPVGTTNGQWYILVVVDTENDIDETNENNNVFPKSITINTCALADITITYVGTPPTTGIIDQNIQLIYQLKNIGGLKSATARVGCYISYDDKFDPETDIYFDDNGFNSLNPGSIDDETSSFTIPECQLCGNYYVIMVADYQNLVPDGNKQNNIYVFPIQITGCITCSVTVPTTGTNFFQAGGSGNIGITTNSKCCKWSATTSDSWITIINSSGIGSGFIRYTVAPCTGIERTGVIYVDGQPHQITQSCVANCENALSFDWAIQAGSTTHSDAAVDLAMDANGNLYSTGDIQGAADFGNGIVLTTPTIRSDIFVSKHNSSGQLQWVKQFSSDEQESGDGIATDNAGNIYVIGSIYALSSITFGSTTITNSSDADGAFLLKLNSAGDVLWAKKINSSNGANANDIALDNANNIYITGNYFDATTAEDAIFITKYNVAGTQLWYKNYSSDFNYKGAAAIACDIENNIIIGGYYRSKIILGSTTLNATSEIADMDAFICKLDESGNVIWAKKQTTIGLGQDELRSIAIDNQNNIYATGTFDSTLIVDNITIPLSNTSKLAFIKYDKNGNLLWVKAATEGTQYNRNRIIISNQNKIFFSGNFNSAVKIDQYSLSGIGDNDNFVGEISEAGEISWMKKFGGIQGDGNGGLVVKDSTMYINGDFENTVNFDNSVLTSNGKGDIFLTKINLTKSVKVYEFIGNGNWSIASNWSNNTIPPLVLPSCSEIIINPIFGGECILNINPNTPQIISPGAKITVAIGKKFRILENLTIQ